MRKATFLLLVLTVLFFTLYATEASFANTSLSLEMFNGNKSESVNSIMPRFKITNTGSESINLADVKLRYYYTIDGEKPQSFWCDHAVIVSPTYTSVTSNVYGNFVKISEPMATADYYLEIGLRDNPGQIAPHSSLEIQSRIAKADWTNYTQSNDYSFNPSASNFVSWDKVTAYISGELVFGKEPAAMKSSNADLKSLSISEGTLSPAFDKETLSYTAEVENQVNSIVVTAEAEDTKAQVTGIGTKALGVGENTIEVTVTAEDATTEKTYTITITRRKSEDIVAYYDFHNGELQGWLGLGNAQVQTTTEAVYEGTHSLFVTGRTESWYMPAVAVEGLLQTGEEYEISGYVMLKEGSSTIANLAIQEGPSWTYKPLGKSVNIRAGEWVELKATYIVTDSCLPKILCISIDGVNAEFYVDSVTIRRISHAASSNTHLKSLSISEGTLTPAFNKETLSYTAAVENQVSSITISAEAEDGKAQVIGIGTKNLAVGGNPIEITVTAEDSTTEKTYNITITRKTAIVPISSNANLKSLSISQATLTPVFNKDTLSYTAAVENQVSSVTISAEAEDTKAQIIGVGSKSLAVGTNPIDVKVTAEDATEKVYRIEITRAAATNGSSPGGNSGGGGGGSSSGTVGDSKEKQQESEGTQETSPLKKKILLTIGKLDITLDDGTHQLDTMPFIDGESNRTLVPLRVISEALGATVTWLPETRQVLITEGDTKILLTIGSKEVLVNGKIILIDTEPRIIPPGRTFVPLRFISEVLGATLDYNQDTSKIIITY